MGVTKVNKAQLIVRTNYLYRTQGYYKTTMADIAATCGINKASLYHYFTGKEDFSLAVIQSEYEYLKEHWFKPALDPTVSRQQRLLNFVQNMEHYCLESEGGLLMMNIAAETGDLIPAFSKRIQEFFSEWTSVLMELLKNKHAPEQAKIAAESFIARLQGAIVLRNLFKDDELIKRQCFYLLNLSKENEKQTAVEEM